MFRNTNLGGVIFSTFTQSQIKRGLFFQVSLRCLGMITQYYCSRTILAMIRCYIDGDQKALDQDLQLIAGIISRAVSRASHEGG